MLTTTPTAAQLQAAYENLRANAWVATSGEGPTIQVPAKVADPHKSEQNR